MASTIRERNLGVMPLRQRCVDLYPRACCRRRRGVVDQQQDTHAASLTGQ